MQVRFFSQITLLILVFVLSGGQRQLSFWLNQPVEEEIVLNELEEEESGEKEESGKEEMETPDLLNFPGEPLSFFEFSKESNLITSVFLEYEGRFSLITSPPPEV